MCKLLTELAAESNPTHSYRLLTETEWEYACRGGNRDRFCYGDEDDARYLRYFAVYASQQPEMDRITGLTRARFEVATKMPNAFGLFDMHGNLWEICNTVYRESYDAPEPEGLGDDSKVVQRGGAVYSAVPACRSAQRNWLKHTQWTNKAGFRIVLVPEATP